MYRMTLENCKRLLAHYEMASKPGFTTGSPPVGLSESVRLGMVEAAKDMKAHMAEKYGKKVKEPAKK